MDNRAAALAGMVLKDQTGLEIGPLNRPLVSRPDHRVFYADHCSTADLRAKYGINPEIDVDEIVEVDFDLSRGRLPEVAADVAPFDYVVASHVGEHVPDLIGWLKDLQAILRPGGVLALVLPDKRFSLDLHRRETAFFDLEAAHREGRTRPGLETVLDHFLNIVDTNVAELWQDWASGRNAPRVVPPGTAPGLIQQWNTGGYMDAHCWVFTPWSCVELLGMIIERHDLDFRLRLSIPTPFNQLEFYLQLERALPDSKPTDWHAATRSMRARAPRPGRKRLGRDSQDRVASWLKNAIG